MLHANRLSVQGAHKRLHVVAVVAEQNCQSDDYENGVGGENAGLEHPHGHAEKFGEPAEQVDQGVHHPFVPPHGKPGKDSREPSGAVDAKTVDDFRVEEAERGAEVLDAIHEESVVDFVDVVFVDEEIVEARPGGGKLGVELGIVEVELARKPEAQRDESYGSGHECVLSQQGVVAKSNCASIRFDATQGRFEKTLEGAFFTPENG